MNNQNINKKNKIKERLSLALRKNLKLRKRQLNDRQEKNIRGQRINKVGFSSLIDNENNK